MDGGAWSAAVHGVTKRQTQLSDFTFTFHFHALEKEMATHSSVSAWRIPGMGEPDGLLSMGSHRVGHDWGNLAAAAAAVVLFYWCNWEPWTMKQPLSIRNKQPKYCIHEQERVICTSFRFRKCYDLSVCITYKFICQNAVEQRWRLREQTCGHRCGRGG